MKYLLSSLRQLMGDCTGDCEIVISEDQVPALVHSGRCLNLSRGVHLIAAERGRQMYEEGWSAVHDDTHDLGEMALAAVAYASPFAVKVHGPIVPPGRIFSTKAWVDPWPWDDALDKRKKFSRIRQLTVAGALIAAELDRLIRADERG